MDYLSRTTGGNGTALPNQWWRVTTATRVFTLALATGLALSDGSFIESAPLVATLAIVVTVSSTLEWGSPGRASAWVPAVEAFFAAMVLTNAPADGGLFAYLAAPPIVAGIRYGTVNTINTALVGGLTLAVMLSAARSDATAMVGAVVSWLLAGTGAGMLASWQSRSNRDLVERLAPYSAAHHLMTQLHGLAREGTVGLDSASLASELERAMRTASGAARSGVFIATPDPPLRLLAHFGEAQSLSGAIGVPDEAQDAGVAVVPLRGTNGVLGHCVLAGVVDLSGDMRAQLAAIADAYALRLDTAMLFDSVRRLATSEERHRIAREMHDGVAQEVVALGYVVDEIESVVQDDDVRKLAAGLREEISRVVTELRYSILDLRHQTDEKISVALAEYAQQVSRDTDIRVHLVLDSSGPQLHSRTQSELLRIAQEAIINVRRHARATNLWVTYVHTNVELRLEIADDGVGGARAKENHWGLQTMSERARAVGAELIVTSGHDGGTVVRLLAPPPAPAERTL